MYLDDSIQKKLRQIGKITDSEVLLKEGDLFIAVNVITQQRRVIKGDSALFEVLKVKTQEGRNRQVLKG